MTRELEELGGGDARIGRAAVCVAASPSKISCQSILETSASGLTVQHERGSRGSKTFPLTHFQDNTSLLILTNTLAQVGVKSGGTDIYAAHSTEQPCLFQAPVDWLFDGFNATLFAYGQSGTGKSVTLFAEGCNAEQPLFHSIMQRIFAQKLPAAHGGHTHRIGFSYWEVLQHQVLDLLAPSCQELGPNQVRHASCCAVFSVMA